MTSGAPISRTSSVLATANTAAPLRSPTHIPDSCSPQKVSNMLITFIPGPFLSVFSMHSDYLCRSIRIMAPLSGMSALSHASRILQYGFLSWEASPFTQILDILNKMPVMKECIESSRPKLRNHRRMASQSNNESSMRSARNTTNYARTMLWETFLLPVFMSLLQGFITARSFLGITLMISRSSKYAATELFAGAATTGSWFQRRSLAS